METSARVRPPPSSVRAAADCAGDALNINAVLSTSLSSVEGSRGYVRPHGCLGWVQRVCGAPRATLAPHVRTQTRTVTPVLVPGPVFPLLTQRSSQCCTQHHSGYWLHSTDNSRLDSVCESSHGASSSTDLQPSDCCCCLTPSLHHRVVMVTAHHSLTVIHHNVTPSISHPAFIPSMVVLQGQRSRRFSSTHCSSHHTAVR